LGIDRFAVKDSVPAGGLEIDSRRRLRGSGWLRVAVLLLFATLAGSICLKLARKASIERAVEGLRRTGSYYARSELERDRPVVSIDLDSSLVDDSGRVHSRRRATDNDLALLISFDRLRELSLAGAAVTDAGLAHLSGLKSLKQLNLRGTRVTDAGLVQLEGLRNLERLDLRETRVTASGIAALQASLPDANIVTDLD
jgi:hypothetical protein